MSKRLRVKKPPTKLFKNFVKDAKNIISSFGTRKNKMKKGNKK